MKIAVLTHSVKHPNHKRFFEIGTARGHEVIRLHLPYCYMNITAQTPKVYYRDHKTIIGMNALIPLIHPNYLRFGGAILKQFETMGVYSLNPAASLLLSRDKLQALQQIANQKIPMPITGFSDAAEETEKLIEIVGGAPLIVRILEGMEGKETIFAETYQAAISVIAAFKQLKTTLLVQEFIEEAQGADIRCVVIGKKVCAAIQRISKKAGKNFSRGDSLQGKKITISEEEQNLAVKAAEALNLNLATVDLIRAKRNTLVLDIGATPHIDYLERVSDTDLVTPIFEFIEQNITGFDLNPTTAKQ